MQSAVRHILPMILLSSLATLCYASCDECGCVNARSGGKICKLVCEEKTISVVCYKCEEEDFCIPNPSCKGCKHCETACEGDARCDCDHCGHSHSKSARPFVWFNWKPGTACLATKKKLYTKTVKKKIPSYKWVVVDTCECGACATTFHGKDTGYTKSASPDAEVGHTATVSKKELVRLASSRPRPAPLPNDAEGQGSIAR